MGHFLGSFRPTFPLFSLGSALPLLFQRSTIQAALHNVCNAHLLYAPIKSNLLLNKARFEEWTDIFRNCFLSFLKTTKRTQWEWVRGI